MSKRNVHGVNFPSQYKGRRVSPLPRWFLHIESGDQPMRNSATRVLGYSVEVSPLHFDVSKGSPSRSVESLEVVLVKELRCSTN